MNKENTPTRKTQEVDNIIIGGGLAGLYCAWLMQQQNQQYVLFEASSMPGGRIQPASKNVRIDTGATWFWPHQKAIQSLVKELNLDVIEQYTVGDTLFQQPDGPIQSMSYQQGLSYKLKGGAAEIIRQLSQQLNPQTLHYDSPVFAVEKCAYGWQISSQRESRTVTWRSKNLFIAVPPRMVVKHLTPRNWLSKQAIEHLAMQQTWMSAQAKYVAVFNQPLWRDRGHSGFAISHRGPLSEIHDASTGTEHFALFGFIGTPVNQRTSVVSQQLKLACRKQICEMYDLPEPAEDFVQDWAYNTFITSKQDLRESPRHCQVDLSLVQSEPDLTDCYFVGSEYSQSEPGYMEGAIDAVNSAIPPYNEVQK